KSSTAAHFANAVCRSGERCLYFAFEESESQIYRNMRSIGLELKPLADRGLLRIHAARPSLTGLESHLASMQKLVGWFEPRAVIIDPISNLIAAGTKADALLMVVRLMDYLKMQGITAFMTNLTGGGEVLEATDIGISSLID